MAQIRQTNSGEIRLFLFPVENAANLEKSKYTFDKACHKLPISVFTLFPDDAVNLEINYKVAKIKVYN